jgi:hypothetical protein
MAPDDRIRLDPLTRRQVLVRGGLALGAVGAASLGLARPLAAAPPAGRSGFDSARRQSYVALVSAVAALGSTPADAARAQWAADRMAADYAGRLPESRQAIDGVLDALGRRGFARMDDRSRVALLRGWVRSGRGDGDLAGQATALATLPFTPPPESYDDVVKPVPVTL